MRKELHSLFSMLKEGVSEFTFANIYLFREAHNYRISRLGDNFLITGSDGGERFFMLPFALPSSRLLNELFERFSSMKCVSEKTKETLAGLGFKVTEDRDNFDYLYSREEMSRLSGRKFHRKKNLVNAFISRYSYEGRPLTAKYVADALDVLERWRRERGEEGDYHAAREALEEMNSLGLCGGIYYVEGEPAAYTLGEELGAGDTFAIHFEKGLFPSYKGLSEFMNQAFASILPEKYRYINMEQDLGMEGLRKLKMSLRPVGFTKKYRVRK
ncbi:MAG: DUF2156 domain-containing protein [Deltaproteobacteria bacterium]|nr:DUF2156 domain-containing protein [Deltaproteobacteria bacterium]